jgi:hypothetical protein
MAISQKIQLLDLVSETEKEKITNNAFANIKRKNKEITIMNKDISLIFNGTLSSAIKKMKKIESEISSYPNAKIKISVFTSGWNSKTDVF